MLSYQLVFVKSWGVSLFPRICIDHNICDITTSCTSNWFPYRHSNAANFSSHWKRNIFSHENAHINSTCEEFDFEMPTATNSVAALRCLQNDIKSGRVGESYAAYKKLSLAKSKCVPVSEIESMIIVQIICCQPDQESIRTMHKVQYKHLHISVQAHGRQSQTLMIWASASMHVSSYFIRSSSVHH